MRPTVVLAANDGWNIVNYRKGLIEALQKAGYHIGVAAPEGAYVDMVRAMGTEFHPIAMAPKGTSPISDLTLLRDFVRLLRRVRPTALLGFTAKPNIYGSMAAQLCGVPVVNNISGLGTAFTRRNWLMWLVSGLYRVALRRSSTVFFQNRDDLALFESMHLVPRGRSRLLPGSGVDTVHFAPPTERPAEPFIFLLAARLLWQKGIAEFVEAARRIGGDRPEVRFRILGIVEPPSAAAVSAEQLRDWEAVGIIDYLGALDDVRPAYAAAHCIVLPSYYREGVPRVLLEASSMALPVITTDMPGCRDAVDDGVTGIICEPRSVDALDRAMRQMLDLGAQARAAMGDAGRAKMERDFREELVHRAYLEALGELGLSGS
jgi:glycosyltransferase involved in cell wall biosynthesis